MTRRPGVVPFRFDLSDLVRRSVATLYSHLVTRPTGQALRMGIQAQIGEMGDLCLSVLDFTEVVVLDYSCADETVAKLLRHYQSDERPANAYFVARGVGEHHRETLEAVLERHDLLLVADVEGSGVRLLGRANPLERAAWDALEDLKVAPEAELVARLGTAADAGEAAVRTLVRRRVAVPGAEGSLHALTSFLVS